ncbi:unnamed protein product [Amoebophrya sp. A25]|nr:unnamed protein product [Amoebophrya sp. A25]|eukprot:GSA25T00004289001.1
MAQSSCSACSSSVLRLSNAAAAPYCTNGALLHVGRIARSAAPNGFTEVAIASSRSPLPVLLRPVEMSEGLGLRPDQHEQTLPEQSIATCRRRTRLGSCQRGTRLGSSARTKYGATRKADVFAAISAQMDVEQGLTRISASDGVASLPSTASSDIVQQNQNFSTEKNKALFDSFSRRTPLLVQDQREAVGIEMDAYASPVGGIVESTSRSISVPDQDVYSSCLNAELLHCYENFERHVESPTDCPLVANELCFLLEHFALMGRKLPRDMRMYLYRSPRLPGCFHSIDTLAGFLQFASPRLVEKRRPALLERARLLLTSSSVSNDAGDGETSPTKSVGEDTPSKFPPLCILLHKLTPASRRRQRQAVFNERNSKKGVPAEHVLAAELHVASLVVAQLQAHVESNGLAGVDSSDLVAAIDGLAGRRGVEYAEHEEHEKNMEARCGAVFTRVLAELVKRPPIVKSAPVLEKGNLEHSLNRTTRKLQSEEIYYKNLLGAGMALSSAELARLCDSLTDEVSIGGDQTLHNHVSKASAWIHSVSYALVRANERVTPAELASVARFVSSATSIVSSEYKRGVPPLLSAIAVSAQKKAAEFSASSLATLLEAFARVRLSEPFLVCRLALQLPRIGESPNCPLSTLRRLREAFFSCGARSEMLTDLFDALEAERVWQAKKPLADEREQEAKRRKSKKPTHHELWTGHPQFGHDRPPAPRVRNLCKTTS